ncbi:MAG: thiamine-monophosphate kinase [Pedosphaera sp.]|nr:thiamine-monophosphate kinase [Pedosphaera sp.]
MDELSLIKKLCAQLPTSHDTIVGPGDDCAVIDLQLPDRWLLFKTDAIVEGVHFAADAPPEKIGRKAIARCLSDIAAMAGDPKHALITLGLPTGFDSDRIQEIYRGAAAIATAHNTAIVGGETTTNPVLLLSIAMIGSVRKDRCILRKGGQPGDALFVTGQLGGSIHGKHLDFTPRLNEAVWLAEHFRPHSMIDLSDGLASDLRHLLETNQLGADILASAIPISLAAKIRPTTGAPAKAPLMAALTDGEDYELLFSLAGADAVPLLDAWKKQFPETNLSCIGKITETPGINIRDAKGIRTLPPHGYVHFK